MSGSANDVQAPRVSVLMPARNAARFLPATLASIVAQTMTDWELVAVDDGSSDDTPRLLAELAARDPRVRVLRTPGEGLVAALNRGLRACRAEFVARIDADDVARPDRLERQLQRLAEKPGWVAVGGAIRHVDEDGDAIALESFPTEPADVDRNLIAGRAAIAHPAILFRRSSVLAVGGYRPMRIGEDLDLWLRLAEIGEVGNLPDVVLDYRRHATSLVQETLDVRNDCVNRVLADARARRGLPELPASRRKRRKLAPGMTLHGKLARMAARAGNTKTAIKHARRQWQAKPFHPTSARVVVATAFSCCMAWLGLRRAASRTD